MISALCEDTISDALLIDGEKSIGTLNHRESAYSMAVPTNKTICVNN